MGELLSLALAGPRATITLDRPEKHNLIEMDDIPRFLALLDEVDAAPEVRVLIVTGAGEKTFCSGIAIGDIGATDWSDNPLERLVARLERVRVPTICALNGSVYGGACDLALACDFRLGVAGMRLVLPAAKLALMYNVTGLKRLVERLGLNLAKRILLLAEEIDDRTLLSSGYLFRLVPWPELKRETDALAGRLEGLSPLALAGMKRALNEIARGEFDAEAAQARILQCFASEDAKEGARAFAERRDPRFSGR